MCAAAAHQRRSAKPPVPRQILCTGALTALEAGPHERLVLVSQPIKGAKKHPRFQIANFLMGSVRHARAFSVRLGQSVTVHSTALWQVAQHPFWEATLSVVKRQSATLPARLSSHRSVARSSGSHATRTTVIETTGSAAITEVWRAGYQASCTPLKVHLNTTLPSAQLDRAGVPMQDNGRPHRRAVVFAPPVRGASLDSQPFCWHLNFFTWGISWQRYERIASHGWRGINGSSRARHNLIAPRKDLGPGVFGGLAGFRASWGARNSGRGRWRAKGRGSPAQGARQHRYRPPRQGEVGALTRLPARLKTSDLEPDVAAMIRAQAARQTVIPMDRAKHGVLSGLGGLGGFGGAGSLGGLSGAVGREER